MRLYVQMEIVIYHKFTQHKDLKRELLSTGNAELIEVRAICRWSGHQQWTYGPL